MFIKGYFEVRSEIIWSKALEVTKEAVDCGAIIPLDTTKYKSKEASCDYELRFLKSPIPKYLREYGPKRNPFIPWDKRLEIQSIYKKHTVILNKYPVQIGHMLLITNKWKPQDGWLNIEDFKAIENVDKDTTGLWFFNSGPLAGASQPHRHIQLLRRDPSELSCPRENWILDFSNANYKNKRLCKNIIIKKFSKSFNDENIYKIFHFCIFYY